MSTGVIDAVRRHLVDEAELGAYVAARPSKRSSSVARADGRRARRARRRRRGLRRERHGRSRRPPRGVAVRRRGCRGRRPERVGAQRRRLPPPGARASASCRSIGDGAIDLDALAAMLDDDPPALVHVTPRRLAPAPRPTASPPSSSAGPRRRRAGVGRRRPGPRPRRRRARRPTPSTPTSRKWLNRPAWRRRRRRRRAPLAGAAAAPAGRPCPPDASPVRHLESHEANIAGRVGFAVAARRARRARPGGGPAAPGRGRPADPPGARRRDGGLGGRRRTSTLAVAITAVRPTGDGDVTAARARLLDEHRILTTVAATGPGAARDDRTAAARQPVRRRHADDLARCEALEAVAQKV